MIKGLPRAGLAGSLTMKRGRCIFLIAGLIALAQPAVAFQETSGGTSGEPAAAVAPPATPDGAKPSVSNGKGMSFSAPELSIGKGTEVRIPGIGTVGVLPKLDFGLELLYGATDPKGIPEERLDPSDVQIRGTIKHRF